MRIEELRSHFQVPPDHYLGQPPPADLATKDQLADSEKPELYWFSGKFIAASTEYARAFFVERPITFHQLPHADQMIAGENDGALVYPLNDFSRLSLLVKERLDVSIKNLMDVLKASSDPEIELFYKRLNTLTGRHGKNPQEFIERGTTTAADIIQGIAGVIPKVVRRDFEADPNFTAQVAGNSTPVLIGLAQVHLQTLRDVQCTLRVGNDRRIFSPYDPKHFYVRNAGSKPSISLTQEAQDAIEELQTKPRSIKSNPGCPAISSGSIKKMWKMHMPTLREIYQRTTPAA